MHRDCFLLWKYSYLRTYLLTYRRAALNRLAKRSGRCEGEVDVMKQVAGRPDLLCGLNLLYTDRGWQPRRL